MTHLQSLFQDIGNMPQLKKSLLSKYPYVAMDPEIQSGWPCIKETRVRVVDIFRATVKGYSNKKIIMQFKEMDVNLTTEQLNQAFCFTLEWINFLNASKNIKTSG